MKVDTRDFNERNLAKSRAAIDAMDEAAGTDMRALTERERQILDMWPKFKDGKYVWFGDAYINPEVDANKVRDIRFEDRYVFLVGIEGFHTAFNIVKRVKRHAPKVLDADGVEIKVGDTVHEVGTGREFTVERLPNPDAYQGIMLRCPNGGSTSLDASRLTHTRPDSWEQLERDAQKNACDYFGVECDSEAKCRMCPHFQDDRDCSLDMNADIIRRAKKLAGVEVD